MSTTTTGNTPGVAVGSTLEVQAILIDTARRGLVLQATAGNTLRFRPRSAMTPELANRIQVNKPALLLRLRGNNTSDTTTAPDTPTHPGCSESGVLSVVSVSEQKQSPHGLWSEEELALFAIAGTTPANMPLVEAVKDVLADLPGGGATVVSVQPVKRFRSQTRHRVAQLIREARRTDLSRAVAMRDTWHERVAICSLEAGLPQEDAERTALAELDGILL